MTVEERIRSDIETRIHNGALQAGDRIPFEHELLQTYGCSRATVSKALTTLARAGLIERRRKAGSFVAHPTVHSAVLEVPDLSRVIADRGEIYAWHRTRLGEASPQEDFPVAALSIEGVHCGGGEPIACEQRLIALAAVPQARDESFEEEAPGTWLLRHIPWTAARHRIRAVEANATEARALQVRPRTACLELLRTTWRAGEPVTRVRQLFRGDRFDLVAEFNPRG